MIQTKQFSSFSESNLRFGSLLFSMVWSSFIYFILFFAQPYKSG